MEEALLLDSSESNCINDCTSAELAPRLIPEFIVALLRGCDLVKSWPSITTANYQMFLRRLFRHKCEVCFPIQFKGIKINSLYLFQEYDIANPFNTDTDFHSLSLRTKVVILNYLCDFRLDSADVELITNGFEANSLRIEPLGYDSNGSIYWYFFGTRLYREDFRKSSSSKRGSDRIWQVICFSEQDWQNLENKFKASRSRKELALHKILSEDFLPNIPVLFKAKEAERRRRYVYKNYYPILLSPTDICDSFSRLFQRRSSLRVKKQTERQKDKLSDDNLPILSEDDSDNKLSHSEKYLEEKKKQFIAKSKIREKIQNDRALRAQRRLEAKP